jgi:MoaA/NifB/PqqE/SkfB family radical SAM enzyme
VVVTHNYPDNGCFNRNLSLQNREIRENKVDLQSYPTNIGIILGNRCNLKCRMCGNKGLFTRIGIRKIKNLGEEALNDTISYFPYLKNLVFSGGEPLLYKEIKDIVEVSQNYPHLRLNIITNGNLINDYWAEKFCEIPFKTISISIDAATNDTYKKIRIRGDFDNLRNSIKEINDLKNNKEPEIQFNFVVMRRNMHEILDFMELAHKYDISRVSYQAISNQRFAFYNLENVTSVSKHCFKLLKTGEKLRELAEDYEIKLINRIPANILNDSPKFFYEYYNINHSDLNDNGSFKCDINWKKLDISPSFYNTCPYSALAKYAPILYYSGEALKISDAWNNKAFIKSRKKMVKKEFDKTCRINCIKFFNHKTKGVI